MRKQKGDICLACLELVEALGVDEAGLLSLLLLDLLLLQHVVLSLLLQIACNLLGVCPSQWLTSSHHRLIGPLDLAELGKFSHALSCVLAS